MRNARSSTPLAAAVAAITLSLLLVGCGSGGGTGNTLTNPTYQPEVANVADNFQLQATNVTNVTQVKDYTWQNSGTWANVDQSGTVTAGTAGLRILDANGVQVYSKSLDSTGTFQTSTGATGAWTIRVTLTNYSGTLNFRVQKGG